MAFNFSISKLTVLALLALQSVTAIGPSAEFSLALPNDGDGAYLGNFMHNEAKINVTNTGDQPIVSVVFTGRLSIGDKLPQVTHDSSPLLKAGESWENLPYYIKPLHKRKAKPALPASIILRLQAQIFGQDGSSITKTLYDGPIKLKAHFLENPV